MEQVELENGKYTIVNSLDSGGGMLCLRYGKPWRNLAGDNLVLAMFHCIKELEEQVAEKQGGSN